MIRINNHLVDISLVDWIRLHDGNNPSIYFDISGRGLEISFETKEEAIEVFNKLSELCVK